MPTLDWIRESIIDRWIDSDPPLEPPAPAPNTYRCPFCVDRFLTNRELLEHLAGRHHGERPVLMINGVEPATETKITVPVVAETVLIENCTSCTISINGAHARPFDVKKLPTALARERDSIVSLELSNAFDKIAQPIRQSFRFTIRVATKTELDAVDSAFQNHLATDAPTFNTVDRFLSQSCCRGAARDYADALATYVRGILLKDRPEQAVVTLPHSGYRELYGQALEVLRAHRRPLADLICAIIRFGRNDFRMARTRVHAPALDRANLVLAGIIEGAPHDGTIESVSGVGGSLAPACPIDHGISRVIVLAGRLMDAVHWSASLEEECRQAASAITLGTPDREKILALWAATALRLGAPAVAQEPLALLSATYPFDLWASKERERSTAR